jgi:hypothetical protein
MISKRRQFPSAAILCYLFLGRQLCLALWNYVRLSSGTPTPTNPYDGRLPPPFSVTYPYGDTAATVSLPPHHLVLHFLPRKLFLRHSHTYQSVRRQPPPPRHLVFDYVTTSGTPNHTVYLRVQRQRRRGRGGSPFTVQPCLLPQTLPLLDVAQL